LLAATSTIKVVASINAELLQYELCQVDVAQISALRRAHVAAEEHATL
jgi:hypothetical protein